jgi:hypothetical protein
MYGNRPGWLISVLIAVAMGWMIFNFGRAPAIGKPSGQFKNLAEPIKLPIPPDQALPGVMTQDRDAGEQYRQAIEAYLTDRRTYDKSEPKYYDRRDKLPAIDLLVSAAPAKRATIFSPKPETLVNYRYPWPELDALMKLGMIANQIAFSAQARGDEETTNKYAGACFSLGAKLYEERLTHGELDVGLKLMQTAGDTFKSFAKKKGDAAAVARWEQFGQQTSGYYTTNIQKLIQKVFSAGRGDVDAHAGDVFELARRNPDRMWRVESILKVGRYKYQATRMGDQVGAKRMLSDDPTKYGYEDWTKHEDPAVRTAAKAARELTIEQFRMIQ